MKLFDYMAILKRKINNQRYSPLAMKRGCRDKTPFPHTNKPLFLEVGCGAGLHPILFAKNNQESEAHLIACERTLEKYEKFKRRLTSHGFHHITPIHEDALYWLLHHREEAKERLEKIFFLYPNPYPKVSHRNKRFLAMPLFGEYLRALKPQGLIELRTNEEFYWKEAKALAEEVWNLECLYGGPLKENSPRGITHFERKYLERDKVCYELILRKSEKT